MTLKNIYAGDYGQDLKITFNDVDTDAAADISGYTTSQVMIFTDPDGTETSKTAAFDTDGSDGVIKYTVDSDFLTAGVWTVRGRVTTATSQLTTEAITFTVYS